MNALLTAASSSHLKVLKKLVNIQKGNATLSFLYVTCNKLNNILHFAIENKNEEMVKFIVSCDAENNFLRQEVNSKGLKPFDLDPNRDYEFYYNPHLWEICSSSVWDK